MSVRINGSRCDGSRLLLDGRICVRVCVQIEKLTEDLDKANKELERLRQHLIDVEDTNATEAMEKEQQQEKLNERY